MFMKHGDEVRVWVGGGMDTLINPVVEEGNGVLRNFVLEDVGDIGLKDRDRVTPTHWNGGDAKGPEG